MMAPLLIPTTGHRTSAAEMLVVVIEPMIANAAGCFARIDELGGPDFRIDRD